MKTLQLVNHSPTEVLLHHNISDIIVQHVDAERCFTSLFRWAVFVAIRKFAKIKACSAWFDSNRRLTVQCFLLLEHIGTAQLIGSNGSDSFDATLDVKDKQARVDCFLIKTTLAMDIVMFTSKASPLFSILNTRDKFHSVVISHLIYLKHLN